MEEDSKLRLLVGRFGACHWSAIAAYLPQRSGKQARERWMNQLNPQLKKKNWTAQEDRTILHAHGRVGNKWSSIANLLAGRTDNAVKNRFNSTLKRAIRDRMSYCSTTDICNLSTSNYDSNTSCGQSRMTHVPIDEIVDSLHAGRFSISSTTAGANNSNATRECKKTYVTTTCGAVKKWDENYSDGELCNRSTADDSDMQHLLFNEDHKKTPSQQNSNDNALLCRRRSDTDGISAFKNILNEGKQMSVDSAGHYRYDDVQPRDAGVYAQGG